MELKIGNSSMNLKFTSAFEKELGGRGYSAYEIAVQEGFEGTEEEWLASLVGPPGPQGDPASDHSTLTNRDLPDQHPMSAITGLEEAIQQAVQQRFENDIILAGDWTQVGNLTKSRTGTEVYEASGKTPVEVITDILSQDSNPVTTQPNGTISLVNSGNVEVGNTISVRASTTFNPGAYTYDNSTGVSVSAYNFSDNKEHTDSNISGSTTFNNYSLLVEDNTNYVVTAQINYTEGITPHTQLGNEYPEGKIVPGFITKTSSAIKGVRYMFNGANTEVKTLNSTNIRALSGSNVSNSFSITIPNNCMQVLIAFPKSLNKTLSKVEDVGAFGTDIKARFEKTTVSVEGANSYTAIDYDVWEYKPATKLQSNTYRVTMS